MQTRQPPSGPVLNNTQYISKPSDLPAPVGGVITLLPQAYQVQGMVEIPGVRIDRPGGCSIYGRDPFNDCLVGNIAGPLIQDLPGPGARASHLLGLQNLGGDIHLAEGTGVEQVIWFDSVFHPGPGRASRGDNLAGFILSRSQVFSDTGIELATRVAQIILQEGFLSAPTDNLIIEAGFTSASFSFRATDVVGGNLVNAAANFLDVGSRGVIEGIVLTGGASSGLNLLDFPQWVLAGNVGMGNSVAKISGAFNGTAAYTFSGTAAGYQPVPGLLTVAAPPDPTAPQRFALDGSQEFVTYTGLDPIDVAISALLSAATGGVTITAGVKLQLNTGSGWVDITGTESTSRVESGGFASGQITSSIGSVSLSPGDMIRAVVGRLDAAGDEAGSIFSWHLTVS